MEQETITEVKPTEFDLIEMIGRLLSESVVVGDSDNLHYRAIIDSPAHRRQLESRVMDLIAKIEI